MSQKTYMYDTQWQALLNAISGGDPTAIVAALGDIKDSIDTIETALGNLNTGVTQNSTQWTALVNAISSGGGTIDIDATQWSDLLTEIAKGDMTATSTALNNIYTRLNSIGFNSTQWTNLVNAITNQSLTVDLSNVTSSAVSNLSNVSGATTTDALDSLKSDLNKSIMFTRASRTLINSSSIGCAGRCVSGAVELQCTASLTTWVNIGTISIPPNSQVIVPAVRTGNGSFVGMIRIKTDGSVDLYSTQSLSNNAISFTFGYGITPI